MKRAKEVEGSREPYTKTTHKEDEGGDSTSGTPPRLRDFTAVLMAGARDRAYKAHSLRPASKQTCTLFDDDEVVMAEESDRAMSGSASSRVCGSCQREGACADESCSFCERPVCHECFRVCDTCSQPFCSVCAVMVYEGKGKGDRALCLTCARMARKTEK
jgi:hypothetical protein